MIAYPFPAMSQFSMDRVTFWLFLLLITHWGEAQNCPMGCICQSSQNKLECQTIPNAPLPPLTTEFKSVGSPENLTSESFIHLQPFLVEILDLSHGNIVNVGDGTFSAFGKVKIIDLSQNRIQSLGKDTFRGCFFLREIRLSNNRISKLADTFFENSTGLETIYLDHNALSDTPVFPARLKTIDVSYNKIKNLTSHHIILLTHINVCGNPIEHVSRSWWADTFCMPRFLNIGSEPFIQSIHLEHMDGSYPFTNLTGLNFLINLRNLKIVGFHMNSFIWPNSVGPKITHLTFNNVSCSTNAEKQFLNSLQHTSVEELDLSDSSQLAKILLEKENIWIFLSYLKMLVLHSCNLTSLTSIRMQHLALPAVLSIDVSDNPLHCDCELANHLKVKKILLAGKVGYCATPVRYSGKDLPSILNLLCPSSQTPQESTTQMMEYQEKTTPVDKAGRHHVSGNDPDWTTNEAQEKSTTQMTKIEENPNRVNTDETLKSKYNDVLANQTMHSIVLVFVTIANSALIFSVLLFYLMRKCRPKVDKGAVLYTVRPNGSQIDLIS